MELKDTVDLMYSDDYQERFKAEYWQTKIRYEKLKAANTKQEILCRMNPFPTEKNEDVVRRELMNAQQHCMGEYLHLLELRAELDGIKL